MTKNDFLTQLKLSLNGLPTDDIRQWTEYYSEMIDDRIDEGLSEAEAVVQLGSISEITTQILSQTPMQHIVKERLKPKRELKSWQIVLIILGFPLWLPVIVAIIGVVISVYAVLWAVIISLFAVAVSIIAAFVGLIIAVGATIVSGDFPVAIALLGFALVVLGIGILSTIGCVIITKYFARISKKLWLFLKGCFVKREVVK